MAARAFTSSYIVDLIPSVISSLSRHGYFYDAVEKEIESLFMPWLTKEVNNKLNKEVKVVRACIDGRPLFQTMLSKHVMITFCSQILSGLPWQSTNTSNKKRRNKTLYPRFGLHAYKIGTYSE
jgi:hypothetical protein